MYAKHVPLLAAPTPPPLPAHPPPLHPFTHSSTYLVHGRTISSKKTTQGVANWDIIRKVKDAVSIPVVANGGVETGADAERLLEETGADAVMSSEGLLENPGLFDRDWAPMEELQGVEVGVGCPANCIFLLFFFVDLMEPSLGVCSEPSFRAGVCVSWAEALLYSSMYIVRAYSR